MEYLVTKLSITLFPSRRNHQYQFPKKNEVTTSYYKVGKIFILKQLIFDTVYVISKMMKTSDFWDPYKYLS